ncbi:MAG TPA: four helix bundle protein, partial [Gemmatimonadaceae bacterium]
GEFSGSSQLWGQQHGLGRNVSVMVSGARQSSCGQPHPTPMQDFRNLEVWKKAHDLALDVHRTLMNQKRIDPNVRSQATRAAQSIPTNVAEGCGKDSRAELARFADIAIGSGTELEYHLLLARDLGQLGRRDYDRLAANTVEVRRMLFGLRKAIKEGKRKAPASLAVASTTG